jgi:hypothetical protein
MSKHELLNQYFNAFDVVSGIYHDNVKDPKMQAVCSACLTVETKILDLERLVIEAPFTDAPAVEDN